MSRHLRSVYIVDDSEHDQFLAQHVLEKTGRVECIRTMSRAAQMLELIANPAVSHDADPESFPPSVILLDIHMPDVDGFEFVERYTELQSTIDAVLPPIVMVTGSVDQRDRKRAEATRAVAEFVEKPVREDDVLRLIERFGA